MLNFSVLIGIPAGWGISANTLEAPVKPYEITRGPTSRVTTTSTVPLESFVHRCEPKHVVCMTVSFANALDEQTPTTMNMERHVVQQRGNRCGIGRISHICSGKPKRESSRLAQNKSQDMRPSTAGARDREPANAIAARTWVSKAGTDKASTVAAVATNTETPTARILSFRVW